MKTLYLLRHAKSSWKDAGLADFDRPLNERGRRAAPFMGRLMRDRGADVDLIISSPAKRARKTAKLFLEAGGFETDVLNDERIYEASPSTLMYVAGEIDDRFSSVVLVGHNPGMEGLIRALTGQSEPMPTAAIAIIKLAIDSWKDIAAGVGVLATVIRPRDVMDERADD
jgi:phosphohistidine phosphatase